mmetsp:Transcript_73329/g.122469  ORF Transcript_73329/g.122469 Transcript_73329/m.122469 type:complete len:490 (+) Transcript_73329:18-1487(+)|eukprot:CAMPEP_0119316056 /NCGR_PEP_ID=MMETSP1333-20130426/38365_1 /TAXON_ID=418940 /ORGANISM="Scyphosphaera apsteinii, Strain RCC1455" /LENGTH=489 /DNA_ID=CAMNT_0007321595 /DNA_START=6 /DNA_END=1475 /DNA_ORIENTATION=+
MFSRTFAKAGARLFSSSSASAGHSRRAAYGAAAAAAAAAASYGYMTECLKIEIDDATATKLMSALSGASKAPAGPRYNTLRPSPPDAKYKLAVVEFNVPGALNGGSDKGPDGHRVDSIPIANGVIKTGNACDIIKYYDTKHAEFAKAVEKYDALIVRINPGQLSQGTLPGTQERFDDLMCSMLKKGKLVWSSPDVQTKMGAKDALVMINKLSCGLPDTLAYYSADDLEKGFKTTCAFQPRVIKQNRGSAGEGIWLCWLASGKYPSKNYGDCMLGDDDYLKLMEMNDNHTEYHTVSEFLEFCVNGPGSAKAGNWYSTFPGKYLEGGKEAGGQLVDQRLLPRISEGEVRMLMVKDTLHVIIHKKPEGGLSAVGGNSAYTYYQPGAPEYADLEAKFLYQDLPQLKKALSIEGEPLPLLWTSDFIPMDGATPGSTEYVVGEFNCSCVGISKFQAVCGGTLSLADVPDEDYYEAVELTDLMGSKAIEILVEEGK